MNTLQNKLRERLSHHKINKLSIGVYALKIFSKYYNLQETANGTFKNGILFIKLDDSCDKAKIFITKTEFINHLNTKLVLFGYSEKLKNIIFK